MRTGGDAAFCLLLATVFFLALPGAALAHGKEPVIPDAVNALQQGPIYVDFDARPSLTELEADRLGRTLDELGDVFVAVLPASAGEELATTADGVADEIADSVGRDGAYLVSVGGRLAVSGSGLSDDRFRELDATTRGEPLSARLTTIATGLAGSDEDGGGPRVGLLVAVGLLIGASAGLVWRFVGKR
jgi:hypothetical protein